MSERFWKRVKKADGCWLWAGAINTCGYGWIAWRGTQTHAHRVSYELTHGPIPKGLSVLHHCDVRACVRPDHLYLGTQVDNMRDRARRGRIKRQKLSVANVKEIRLLRSSGWTLQAIADKFDVQSPHISEIVNGKRWCHV